MSLSTLIGRAKREPEADPNGVDANSPGAKLDSGKPRVWLMLAGFAPALEFIMREPIATRVDTVDGQWYVSRVTYSNRGTPAGVLPAAVDALTRWPWALEEVAAVTTAGAAKYTPNGWIEVPNGYERYLDAYARHTLSAAKGEERDDGEGGTGCLHDAQCIWNLLAAITIGLRNDSHPDALQDLAVLARRELNDLEALLVPVTYFDESEEE